MRFSVLLLKSATLMGETHLLVSQQAHYTDCSTKERRAQRDYVQS